VTILLVIVVLAGAGISALYWALARRRGDRARFYDEVITREELDVMHDEQDEDDREGNLRLCQAMLD
jgi:hypothetical protein